MYSQLLGLAGGVALVAAVLALWRRSLLAIVRILAVQGLAIAAVALLLGIHHREVAELIVAAGVLVLKVAVIPMVLSRVVRDARTGATRNRRSTPRPRSSRQRYSP